MSKSTERSGLGRVREALLAACAGWLVLQNAALLALAIAARPGAGATGRAFVTVARVAAVTLAPAAVIAAALLLGGGLAAWLAHDARRPRVWGASEVHRG